MKNLIAIIALIAALLLVNNAYGQAPLINPTVPQQLQMHQNDIDNINLRLDMYARQHTIGNTLICSGIAAAVLGTVISATYINNGVQPIGGIVVTSIGAALTLSGSIVNATAHRQLRGRHFKSRFR